MNRKMRKEENPLKAINLQSIIAAKQSLPTPMLERFLDSFGIEIKPHELEDLELLVEAIYEHGTIFPLHNFFVGYRIEQISKEFDLLRVCDRLVVDIELKRQQTGERMEKQLRQNRYYLNSLNREVHLFTFVSSERKLYTLKDDRFEETSLKTLLEVLARQENLLEADVGQLFTPTQYLVSPFNQIGPFLNSQYFLTSQQQEFKNTILHLLHTKLGNQILAVEGEAGTGKTLLTYDIAKHFHDQQQAVTIIHCGLLNEGHLRLKQEGFDIRAAHVLDHHLPKSSLIVVDEAQRMHPSHIEKLLTYSYQNDVHLLFSYDPHQYIGREEAQYRNEETFQRVTTAERPFKLTGRIRSNKEMISFTKKLFNRRRPDQLRPYENIHFQYFTNLQDAKQFVQLKSRRGWQFIDYTVPPMNGDLIREMSLNYERNSLQVIGQEFDKVIIIIGEAVTYNEEGRLVDRTPNDYLAAHMIHQNMTRAREQLYVVILNNLEVLETCLHVLPLKEADM